MSIGPRIELRSLEKFVAELQTKFLSPYLAAPNLAPPSRQETLDVAACVVLAHGAIENFVEGVTLWVTSKLQNNWTYHKRATKCTASLLLHSTAASDPEETTDTVFDTLRVALIEASTTASTKIRMNNGISIRHLRSLFIPLGINVPSDPVLVGSLEQLVSMRHEWAHQYRFGAKVVRTALEAKNTIQDCMIFAQKLSDEANSAGA